MQYIVISDYPYYTTKNFFLELQEAKDFEPKVKNLLNSRIYLLESYKETLNGISYGVHQNSRINKT